MAMNVPVLVSANGRMSVWGVLQFLSVYISTACVGRQDLAGLVSGMG